MCLDTVYRGKQKKEALAKLPDSGYYWKVVRPFDGKYYPLVKHLPNNNPFRLGWNRTKSRWVGIGYKTGFHLYKTKEGARGWAGVIIRCKVEKRNIIAIGDQEGLCIVTTRFWCPKPRSKK